MKTVIIAAGEGNRLWGKTNGKPKTLLPFGRGSLLSTILSNFKSIGLDQFVLVLGYQAEIIEQYVRRNLPETDVEIVYNNDWRKGNGISALTARSAVGKESFILSMSDHLVSSMALRTVKNADANRNSLLVDFRLDKVYDLDDATKVRVDNHRIRHIGKEIKDFNAVDCGIFKLTERFFIAMQNQINCGADSISAGITELIRRDDMFAIPMAANDLWIDVDTPQAYHFAEKYFIAQNENNR